MVQMRQQDTPHVPDAFHQYEQMSRSLPIVNDSHVTHQAVSGTDQTTQAFYSNAAAPRVLTDAYMLRALREEHPLAHISLFTSYPGDLLAFAGASDEADARPLTDSSDALSEPLQKLSYLPPGRRVDGPTPSIGRFISQVLFGKYAYRWLGREWILYVVDSKQGSDAYPVMRTQFLVDVGKAVKPEDAGHGSEPPQYAAAAVVSAAAQYILTLRNEIWVFDGGFWRKDANMYRSVEKANWEDVILPAELKGQLQNDTVRFFGSRERYQRLRVPWKRGVIYYGPPGNGKTVSIKALMRMLYMREGLAKGLEMRVEPLYVRSLSSFGGPEYAISQIFAQARASAPCLLVFEDLDSIVTDEVRSYFLNEVDGLAANDGVMMLGSTNHLDRLDPGISKRPSRFDRKFEFEKPDLGGRIKYCEYWRNKLMGQRTALPEGSELSLEDLDIEFPEMLCVEIAKITDDFSFAYLQEAFVASLLAIAAEDEDEKKVEVVACAGGLERLRLWREIKKQVDILRGEM